MSPAPDRTERARYIDPNDAPLAVLSRRAPTPGERRDVAIGRALIRALAQYEGGQAAVIADQHVRGIDGALPIGAIVGAVAGNDWGRRLFKKRIGVLVVRRPDLILVADRPTRTQTSSPSTSNGSRRLDWRASPVSKVASIRIFCPQRSGRRTRWACS